MRSAGLRYGPDGLAKRRNGRSLWDADDVGRPWSSLPGRGTRTVIIIVTQRLPLFLPEAPEHLTCRSSYSPASPVTRVRCRSTRGGRVIAGGQRCSRVSRAIIIIITTTTRLLCPSQLHTRRNVQPRQPQEPARLSSRPSWDRNPGIVPASLPLRNPHVLLTTAAARHD